MDDNIKNLRDALEWLDRDIEGEAVVDGEMSNLNAIRIGFIRNMLARFPPRNCDVGTAEEQRERFAQFCRNCKRNRCGFHPKAQFIDLCALAWAQMPFTDSAGNVKTA